MAVGMYLNHMNRNNPSHRMYITWMDHMVNYQKSHIWSWDRQSPFVQNPTTHHSSQSLYHRPSSLNKNHQVSPKTPWDLEENQGDYFGRGVRWQKNDPWKTNSLDGLRGCLGISSVGFSGTPKDMGPLGILFPNPTPNPESLKIWAGNSMGSLP